MDSHLVVPLGQVQHPEADVVSLESAEDVGAAVHGVPNSVNNLVDRLEIGHKPH